VQVGAAVRGRVDLLERAEALRLGHDGVRAELEVPQHLELAAWVVVVDADEAHERRVVALAVFDALDQPLPVPRVHDLPLVGQAVDAQRGRRRGKPGAARWLARSEGNPLGSAAPCACSPAP
jgi:hypothetical protein